MCERARERHTFINYSLVNTLKYMVAMVYYRNQYHYEKVEQLIQMQAATLVTKQVIHSYLPDLI